MNLIDTAGIRDTSDYVEQIGVNKAKEYASDADLILYVIDSSTALDENDLQIIEFLKEKKAIILLNKSDLAPVVTEQEIAAMIDTVMIPFSAKEGIGLDRLEQSIKDLFFAGDISFNDEIYITNIRQKNAMQDAGDSLRLVMQSIEDGMPEDFYSIDLMNAYTSLGTIIGESLEDDLVNEIFSKFCMGK